MSRFYEPNASKEELISNRILENTHIQRYLEEGYDKTQGWPTIAFPQMVDWLDSLPLNRRGGVMEIGVHGGTTLMLLNHTVSKGESVAIDVFDNQGYNVSYSGGFRESIVKKHTSEPLTHLELFKRHLERFDRHRGANVRIISGDSLLLEPHEVHRGNKFKYISIDGGHDPIHVINDLKLSEKSVTPEGVVILDDWMNVHFLGVTEGAIRYMMGGGNLVPFASSFHKLYMCNYSVAEKYKKFCLDSPYRTLRNTVCSHDAYHFPHHNNNW